MRDGTEVSDIRTNRRQLLRVAGAGLTLPFVVPLMTACSINDGGKKERDDATREAEQVGSTSGGPVAQSTPEPVATPPGYTGSDSTQHGTGGAVPEPVGDVTPFTVFDPWLKPAEAGTKDITVVANNANLYVANNVPYAAWTFDSTVPGPVHRVVQGDTVNVTFKVDPTAIPHSLDFHSAQTPPNVNFRTIGPGEEMSYSFVPKYPGAFMYHCGTPPILMHIGAGMYGAMIVDPEEGWPEAQELVLVQSEFYLQDSPAGIKVPDMTKMMGSGSMDYVAFNGYANQYVENPIKVKAGELIRIFVVNAGPNIWSSFHVVGAIFDTVYVNANPQNKMVGLQTVSIAPADGVAVEFVLEEPGEYVFVNHSFGHAAHGAVGILQAE